MRIMVVRIARILSASLVLALLADVRPAKCDGWSLANPFSSSTKTTEVKRKPAPKATTKDPSVLQKLGTGTKNFFNKTGEAIGLKKPEAKKSHYATATPKPRNIQPVKKESKSWLPSFMQPEEPKKPKNVSEWLAQPRQDM
jgi:hypothetical protein